MQVRLSNQAEADLDQYMEYLASRSDQGVASVANAFEGAFSHIKLFPRSAHKIVGHTDTFRIFTRKYPYVIYYEIREDEVLVITIKHTARADSDSPAVT